MSIPRPHIIAKLVFRIESPQMESVSSPIDYWSEWAKGPLPARLEALLGQHSPIDGGYVTIDRLEVELELDAAGWSEKKLEAAFETAFEQALLKAMRTAKPAVRQEEQVLTWLMIYLDKGAMPSNAPRKMKLVELEDLLTSYFQQPVTKKRLADFIQYILDDKDRLERLLLAFSPDFVWHLLSVQNPKSVQNWSARHRHQLDMLNLEKKLTVWEKLFIDPNTSPNVLNAIDEVQTGNIAEKDVLEEENHATINRYFIENAGLVIVHPFLDQYLKTLLGDGDWDDAKRATAVHLVQYLAVDETAREEWNLPLAKLLCGWPLEKAVPMAIQLPENTASASQSLLEAVINHWEVLKNTSVQGLREAYFQREGILTQSEAYWQLRVEQRPYDMLLDKLPWGIGMIKNKHMNKPLMVEW